MQATAESFKKELLLRRRRLESALSAPIQHSQLQTLLEAVDAALDRIEIGTFGICEVCLDPIEEDRLLANPLLRVCIDHLDAAQRKALEEDLTLAARVQEKLLPDRGLNLAGWQVAHHFEPAGAVSGDYFDLIPADPESGFYFFLGDVSGKGVSASLLMSHLHAIFRSLVSVGQRLDQMLNQANHLFCESTLSSQYATLVAGKVGTEGRIDLSVAGHCPVLAVRQGRLAALESTGLPIGLFCEAQYSVQKVELDPGDSLILFTDGILEASNRADEEYGLERLSRLITEQPYAQPGDLLQTICSDFNAYASGMPKHDDVTLMVIRRSN